MPMHEHLLRLALALISATPGFGTDARRLRRARIRFDMRLPDRGQIGFGGVIVVGPEPLHGEGDVPVVSLAGTLVHEGWHRRQHPLHKTASFWRGVWTRTHPMRRYEQSAYARQAAFLEAVAQHQPHLQGIALREAAAVRASFAAHYE